MSRKYLVSRHQLSGSVRLLLSEWNKLDGFWISGLVSEWRFDVVEVVCADSDQPAAPSNVLMKLVLKINEGCVGTRGELQITEDSAGEQRANTLGLIG